MKTVLGIDNGLVGALAFYNIDSLIVYDMPTFKIDGRNRIDLIKLRKIIVAEQPSYCFIEKLTPLPRISGLTAFSMGHSEGVVEGVLSGVQVPYTFVRPAHWKKAMGCTADKQQCRERANQLLPQFAHNWDKKTHVDRAEASLIALYGMNQ